MTKMKISTAGLQLLCVITLFVLTWLKLWFILSTTISAEEPQLQIEEPPRLRQASFSIGFHRSGLSKNFNTLQYKNAETAIKRNTLGCNYNINRPRVARSQGAIRIRDEANLSNKWARNKEAEKQAVMIEDSNRYLRPDYMTEYLLDQLLDHHNQARSNVDPGSDRMLKMSWDYDLEANAWYHTQKCQFVQSRSSDRTVSGFAKVGENLWVGWGEKKTMDPVTVIETWRGEKKFFDAALRSCLGGECERYSQLVWSESYKIGCAWSDCANIVVHGFQVVKATFLACHYAPGGNDNPLVPYYHGITCSFCDPEDDCSQKLCTNPDREKTTGVVPWPTPPPTTTTTTTTTTPPPALSEEAKVALVVVASLIGSTVIATAVIHTVVRIARRRTRWQLANYMSDIPRRVSLWYDNRKHQTKKFDNTSDDESKRAENTTSHASIEYHANLWR